MRASVVSRIQLLNIASPVLIQLIWRATTFPAYRWFPLQLEVETLCIATYVHRHIPPIPQQDSKE
jgi:hypothetical protein